MIDQMLDRSLEEGDAGSSNDENICVNLINILGGLARDIVVNVNTLDGTAASKLLFFNCSL